MESLYIIPVAFAVMALLLICGSLSTRISSHFNVPTLLMFMAVGMLARWYMPGVEPDTANFVGTLAMCYILFAGGLDTNFKTIKPVFSRGIWLATLGVLLTAVIMAVAVKILLPEWSFLQCLLMGSVVSSTDAAAVFAILRSRSVSLQGKIKPLLEFESGSNDPMAAFLTIFFISAIQEPSTNMYWWFLPEFLWRMSCGVAAGYLFGRVGKWLYNKSKFDYEGLYSVLGIALVILMYGVTEVINGNGFMAVYVGGLTMGNLRFVHKKGLVRFSDGIAWLMQVSMFLVLGLLIAPKSVPSGMANGVILAAVLMLVARPLAVFACLMKSKFSWREQLLISWVGLRGAAPIVLATFPLVAGVAEAKALFYIVFFVVVASVLIQGKTLMPLARLLKLDRPLSDKSRIPLELEVSNNLNGEMTEFDVLDDSNLVGRSLAEIKFPQGALVMLIRRGDHFVLPHGNTVVEANDGLVIMADDETLKKIAAEFFPHSDYDL